MVVFLCGLMLAAAIGLNLFLDGSSAEHERRQRQGAVFREAAPRGVSEFTTGVRTSLPLRVRRQPCAEEFVIGGIDFDNEIFVFIEKTCVVHLQGDGTNHPCGGIMKAKDFDTLAAGRLSDGHTRCSAGGVRENLHTAPGINVRGLTTFLKRLMRSLSRPEATPTSFRSGESILGTSQKQVQSRLRMLSRPPSKRSPHWMKVSFVYASTD